MYPAKKSRLLSFAVTLGALAMLLAAQAFAAPRTYKVIATFSGANGAQPMDALVFDTAGNLYGTTSAGGLGKGLVFELSPNGSGGWTESVIYEFHGTDGSTPYGWLIFDASGNLYGTTQRGGTHGVGSVFELSPGTGGSWTETVLHSFGSGSTDGEIPIAGLAIDSSGNLYGTTFSGGSSHSCTYQKNASGCGTVYELSPGTGGWTYSIIHDFSPSNEDGNFPIAGVAVGPGGVFVETAYGSKYQQGLLLKLTPNGDGTWTEQGLHPWGFVHDGRPDGGYPYSTMVFDSQGFMYGTSQVGGTHGNLGTVFKFTYEPSNNGWLETNLHGFGNPPQGSYPESSLAIDSAFNLYGITNKGGTDGYGTMYELEPTPEGYLYKPLYNFTGQTDGAEPVSAVIMDSAGNLYGTTPYGGDPSVCTTGPVKGCGVVYELLAQ